ncbi:MAG: DUF3088 family protein [Chthoniobacterales bacterium]|nr:DUF3088 family protein [Chthoniobacterales bacterium]
MKTPNRLFLIKPNFLDGDKGPYFCPGCAEVTGLLEFYPALKDLLEIHYVDFARPRPELVDLLGAENQSCPVLVLGDASTNSQPGLNVQSARGHSFVEGAREIAGYLAHTYGIGIPH